jgi:hypothetical protein
MGEGEGVVRRRSIKSISFTFFFVYSISSSPFVPLSPFLCPFTSDLMNFSLALIHSRLIIFLILSLHYLFLDEIRKKLK